MPHPVKAIAFYLPQFHPNTVNDQNWGRGFSDWVNVAKARPLFDGHYQPRLPGGLGFYDLRAPEVMIEQADLARSAGVHGFCFYYYRFGSQRVLEKPLTNWLARPVPDFPFMYCWANESWTRAWDGRSDALLLEQTYGTEMFDGMVADLVTAMRDRRYIRVEGKPLFLIYQVELVPDAPSFVARLREAVFARLGEEISVGCVFSHGFRATMLAWLDVVVQFPPHRIPRSSPRALIPAEQVAPFEPDRHDYFESYQAVIAESLAGVRGTERLYPGITPDWDNSPRRPDNAHVLIGSTPDLFAGWVEQAGVEVLRKAAEGLVPDALLFVNAWNEWGEGAMLEPSLQHGSAYLDALRIGLTRAATAFAAGRQGGDVPVPEVANALPDIPAGPSQTAEWTVDREADTLAAAQIGDDGPDTSDSEDLVGTDGDTLAGTTDVGLVPHDQVPDRRPEQHLGS